MFIGDPVNGLYEWDGGNLVAIGSIGVIGIINPGSGYTAAPDVIISPPNQTGGKQATAVAAITTANTVNYIVLQMRVLGTHHPRQLRLMAVEQQQTLRLLPNWLLLQRVQYLF